jgi:hypothetical protein
LKKLGKYATVASVSDKKRLMNKHHLQEASQVCDYFISNNKVKSEYSMDLI